jgi:pimeloyl-ACP methyl ester carboxylesterase
VERWVADDGVGIIYDVWGGPSTAPPVVLQHGFIADANLNWVLPGVVDALTGAGRRVVALDARGHGRSDKPHDPDRYGEERMARDLMGVVDALDITEYDLVGYSMGAIISVIVGSLDRRVRRLIIGGVGETVVTLGGVDRRALPIEELVAALETDDANTITHPQAAAFRGFADMSGGDRLALAAQARRVHRGPIALDRITAPTMLLVGVDDALAVHPEVLVAAIPDAVLRTVAGDHLGAPMSPEFAPAVVEFLVP